MIHNSDSPGADYQPPEDDLMSGEDVFLDEIEVYDDAEENPLEQAEMEAVAEEDFSEPVGLVGPFADFGFYDPEIIDAEMVEAGAGAEINPEDVSDLGMHIEIPTYPSADEYRGVFGPEDGAPETDSPREFG